MVFYFRPGQGIPSGLCECRVEATAFITPWGLYEFQWYMEKVLAGIRDECCVPYLDDVLCYSKTFDKQVRH